MKKITVLFLVFVFMSSMAVYGGDGNGGGKSPLKLEGSSVEDGAKDVALDTSIDLSFSNNVVNMKVADNNLTCFTLKDSSGNEVSIEVLMGDDQVDPTIKEKISIKPTSPLTSGESYTLIISGDLMAKNGNNMGQDLTINFNTVSQNKMGITAWIIGGLIILAAIVLAYMSRKKEKTE